MGDLRKEVLISTAEMDHSGLSPNEIIILLTQLWCRDSHEFRGEIPDRTRVQLSAAMLLYCFISARTGEVYESTVRRGLLRMPGEDETDKELEARVMVACYKVKL
jgi:carbonic anhydrase